MDKIFGRAEDKYVRQYHLYTKASDEYVYTDSACKTKATPAEARNAFLKRAFVDLAGKMYAITGYAEASGVASVTLLTAGTSSAATLLVMKSVAD